MGLESNVEKVADLNEAWPLTSDSVTQGAAHLRNIKKALRSLISPGSMEIPGRLVGIKWYTSSSVWTRPSGVKSVLVLICGGGGGGGGAYSDSSFYYSGGGGGAGGSAIKLVDVSGVTNVTVTIGAGGTGSLSGSDGGAGGSSTFGPYVGAHGGMGGSINTTGGAGGHFTGSSYPFDVLIVGGHGGDGDHYPLGWTTSAKGGDGGDSLFGTGSKGSFGSYSKSAALGGGGAGGGMYMGTSPHSSSPGASGFCLVLEFS